MPTSRTMNGARRSRRDATSKTDSVCMSPHHGAVTRNGEAKVPRSRWRKADRPGEFSERAEQR